MSTKSNSESSSISFPYGPPEGMGKFEYWRRTHRRLPKPDFSTGVIEDDEQHDSDWKVGSKYFNEDGRSCTVISIESVFMGWSALLEFSNGAFRHLSYPHTLHLAVDADSASTVESESSHV